MAFEWKDNNSIWKGEGIYHLTFVVAGRQSLLGTLTAVPRNELPQARRYNATVTRSQHNNAPLHASANPFDCRYWPAVNDRDEVAMVKLTPLGFEVSKDLQRFEERHPGVRVIKKMIMDDHLHVVVWVHKDVKQSIRQIGHGFRIGITHIAQEMGVWPKASPAVTRPTYTNERSSSNQRLVANTNERRNSTLGLIIEQPFIRTLSSKGQLQDMLTYVEQNAYRKYMRQHHPELFTMHRDTIIKGLHFRSMGNHWLLDWPVRQVVECSRSISEDCLDKQLQSQLQAAHTGAITYTAAISDGEKRIARAIREAGYPVVILLKDGFPQEGSEEERYYKPGGVYFRACNEGKLLLLEAKDDTYEAPQIVEATERALQKKAEAKHQSYEPLPHSSKRWRFIAGNEIIKMLSS